MTSLSTVLSARARLIGALNVGWLDQARRLAEPLSDHIGVFKVALELYARYGARIFAALLPFARSVFFDCKFIAIPNTVAHASGQLGGRELEIFNENAVVGRPIAKHDSPAGAAKRNVTEVESSV